MARPRPTVRLEHTDPKTYKSEQVLKAEFIYAVYMDGQPINLRTLNALVNYPGPKYKKTAFAAPGHAFNLAERLNKLFKTDQFAVFRLAEGEQITENA